MPNTEVAPGVHQLARKRARLQLLHTNFQRLTEQVQLNATQRAEVEALRIDLADIEDDLLRLDLLLRQAGRQQVRDHAINARQAQMHLHDPKERQAAQQAGLA